ncbi:alpha/beta hydrolase family protein [Saccharomonospora cyanea]|uniref:Chlorophyllase n=1 Tax=Saccharomonospora cyanea NA-134 TaxID=882082 RepID=H5XK37_9PSEU|nr:hypothetical protein SaccyDRAFT_4171 [Saccharomonospora cyanea NA-134]
MSPLSQRLPTVPSGGVATHSIAPITLPITGRAHDLELRLTVPVSGQDLPVIVLSHGHGPSNYISSLYGYGPLAQYWAASGFAVIQPTHLDSQTLGLRHTDVAEAPLFWRSRATDVSTILDRLEEIAAFSPVTAGRLSAECIAVAGHSMGAYTASLILGARTLDPETGEIVDLKDERVRVGVLMAAPGRGGDALSRFAAEHYPVFIGTDFSMMDTPALVVRGAADAAAHLTVAGPDWYVDPYRLAPGRKTLVTVAGGEHGLGGVAGYDAAETTDENPERMEFVRQITTAYLRTTLGTDADAWENTRNALRSSPMNGGIESRH